MLDSNSDNNSSVEDTDETVAPGTKDEGSKLQLHSTWPDHGVCKLEKCYKCAICGKGYSYKRTLLVHMKTHTTTTTSEKHIVCRTCGKRFTDAKNLRYHEISHDLKTATLKCDLCPMTFLTRTGLACHQRTHAGQILLSCPKCDRKLVDRSRLERHLLSHNRSRKFPGELLENEFDDSDGLLKRTCLSTVTEEGNVERRHVAECGSSSVNPGTKDQGEMVPLNGCEKKSSVSPIVGAWTVKLEDLNTSKEKCTSLSPVAVPTQAVKMEYSHGCDEEKDSHHQAIDVYETQLENPQIIGKETPCPSGSAEDVTEHWILPDEPPAFQVLRC